MFHLFLAREKVSGGHLTFSRRGKKEKKENLEGNVLENDSDAKASGKSKDDDMDEFATQLLEKDNQIRHAYQLLQSWTIFSQIKAKP